MKKAFRDIPEGFFMRPLFQTEQPVDGYAKDFGKKGKLKIRDHPFPGFHAADGHLSNLQPL